MIVCMISGSFPPVKCGVGDYTEQLCNWLANHTAMNLITSYYPEREVDSYPWSVFDAIESWNFRSLFKIIHLIRNINPDIVHIQYPTTSYKKIF